MTVELEDHPFWDFTLGVYGKDGVSAACIDLQDNHGLDVNVLLFCVWLGHSGRGRLGPEELAAVLGASAAWNSEIVQALRAVRRRLKDRVGEVPADQSTAMGRRILEIEIQCEQVEQLVLAAAVAGGATAGLAAEARAADAVANFVIYFKHSGISPGDDDRARTATILGAAFDDLDGDVLDDLLAHDLTV